MPINNTKMNIYLRSVEGKYTIDELLEIVNTRFNRNFTRAQLVVYCNNNYIKYKYVNPNRKSKYINKANDYYEYVSKKGDTMIKVNGKWQYKQRYIYEKNTNEKLTKNDFIIFLDGDNKNFDFSNLKKVTRKQSQMYGQFVRYYGRANNKELNELLLDIFKLRIKAKRMGNQYE
jgi:hypothetical protein